MEEGGDREQHRHPEREPGQQPQLAQDHGPQHEQHLDGEEQAEGGAIGVGELVGLAIAGLQKAESEGRQQRPQDSRHHRAAPSSTVRSGSPGPRR